MTPYLRDQLQADRINRIKKRAAVAWHVRHCPHCREGRSHGSLVDLLRGGFLPDDDAPPPADKSHH